MLFLPSICSVESSDDSMLQIMGKNDITLQIILLCTFCREISSVQFAGGVGPFDTAHLSFSTVCRTLLKCGILLYPILV